MYSTLAGTLFLLSIGLLMAQAMQGVAFRAGTEGDMERVKVKRRKP